jgi:hypothetical protein
MATDAETLYSKIADTPETNKMIAGYKLFTAARSFAEESDDRDDNERFSVLFALAVFRFITENIPPTTNDMELMGLAVREQLEQSNLIINEPSEDAWQYSIYVGEIINAFRLTMPHDIKFVVAASLHKLLFDSLVGIPCENGEIADMIDTKWKLVGVAGENLTEQQYADLVLDRALKQLGIVDWLNENANLEPEADNADYNASFSSALFNL